MVYKKILFLVPFLFLYLNSHSVIGKNASVGIDCISLFSTVKHIFEKQTNYQIGSVGIGYILKNTVPLFYHIFRKYEVKSGLNFTHDLRFESLWGMYNDLFLKINISTFIQQNMWKKVDKDIKDNSNVFVISSSWLNAIIYKDIFSLKDNDRNCFCFGGGVNLSRMSCCVKNVNKPDPKKYFLYHIWFTFSILGKYSFCKLFSIMTSLSFYLIYIKIPYISTEIEEVDVNNGVNTNFFNANEKGLLCYNKIMKNNFTFLDSPLPSLTISLVLEI